MELRAGSGLVGIHLPQPGDPSVHATDTIVGAKFSWPDLTLFDLALSVDASFPSGTGAFDGGIAGGEARVLLAKGLPAGFGLLVNLGADLPDTGDGRQVRPMHVLNLGYVLPFAEERLSVFAESFGRHPTDGSTQVWQFDYGLAYSVSNDFQLDAFAQHGLTDAAPEFQIAVGASGRFGATAKSSD